ncbi:MAG: hypothetical protein II058_05410, partial [Rhodocyclaceae bacterium]|nr:hypothetical protein [Rhodocyclaceae bacterium]
MLAALAPLSTHAEKAATSATQESVRVQGQRQGKTIRFGGVEIRRNRINASASAEEPAPAANTAPSR